MILVLNLKGAISKIKWLQCDFIIRPKHHHQHGRLSVGRLIKKDMFLQVLGIIVLSNNHRDWVESFQRIQKCIKLMV